MSNLPNIRAVARREVTVRTRTRAFRLGTFVLLLGVAAIALAPVIVRAIYTDHLLKRGDITAASGRMNAYRCPPITDGGNGFPSSFINSGL